MNKPTVEDQDKEERVKAEEALRKAKVPAPDAPEVYRGARNLLYPDPGAL